MLQIPQLQVPSGKPVHGKPPASPAEGDDFAQVLQSQEVSKGPEQAELPPDLVAEALSQLEDGVPQEQVLADLRQGLKEFFAQAAAPGMAQAPVTELAMPELSDEALLARLGLRPVTTGQDKQGAAPLPGDLTAGAEGETELPVEGAAAKPVVRDLPAAMERQPAIARLQVLEPASAANGLSNLGQAAPLKAVELPPSLNGVMPDTAGQVKTQGEALSIPQRVGEQGWGQALAQRVMWMVGKDQQTAELKLNPAHMGPLEVKVSLRHDQASVTLLASNAVVKEALEQALPRLRDMFSEQDIQLVQADVGQRQDPRNGEAEARLQGQGGDGGQQAGTEPQAEEQVEVSAGSVHKGLGLLDTYA